MEKIDNLDRKILGILSKNARIPFKDVAAECGVSRAAIHQRVQHLMEAGITQTIAIVNERNKSKMTFSLSNEQKCGKNVGCVATIVIPDNIKLFI